VLESAGDRCRYYDLTLTIGYRSVHISAYSGTANLLAEAF
jgi:hypothetical protein